MCRRQRQQQEAPQRPRRLQHQEARDVLCGYRAVLSARVYASCRLGEFKATPAASPLAKPMAPSFDAPIAGAANRPTAPATTPWTAHRQDDVVASAAGCWLHAGPVSACACSGRTLPMLLRPEDTPALKSFGLRRLKTVAERSARYRTSSSCLGCMVYPRCTCFPSPRTHCRSCQWTRHLPGLPLAP